MILEGTVISKVKPVYYKTAVPEFEFLVKTKNGIFPIKFTEDKCGHVFPQVPDEISIEIELMSNEWQGKYFVNLYALKMEFSALDRPACLLDEKPEFEWRNKQDLREYVENNDPNPPWRTE